MGWQKTYGDLSHAGVLAVGGLRSNVDGGIALGRSILVAEVVDHLSIEFLNSLGLTTSRVAATSATSSTTAATSLGLVSSRLGGSRRLRLRLRTVEALDWIFEELPVKERLTQHDPPEAWGREREGRGRRRRQLRSVAIVSKRSNYQGSNAQSHLHGTAVNVESIELLGSLQGGVGLAEDDRSNATASTVLVVGEHHLLDGTCRLGKVFL